MRAPCRIPSTSHLALLRRALAAPFAQDDTKYMSLTFTNQAYHVDLAEDAKGCKFKMDPYFFLADFNAGIAWTMLREAAVKCNILILHTENSREWSYTRAMEVVDSLQQGDARSVQCAIVNRGVPSAFCTRCGRKSLRAPSPRRGARAALWLRGDPSTVMPRHHDRRREQAGYRRLLQALRFDGTTHLGLCGRHRSRVTPIFESEGLGTL